jgi:hypothetical protein
MNEYIFKNFNYNPDTGEIKRKDRKNSSGSYDKNGYLILKIKGKQFKAHRIAWFLHYGKFPDKILDHINRIKDDNRIGNLREASSLLNSNNIDRKVNIDTGYPGVYFDNTKRLKKNFAFSFNKKTYRYETAELAYNNKQKLINNLNQI